MVFAGFSVEEFVFGDPEVTQKLEEVHRRLRAAMQRDFVACI